MSRRALKQSELEKLAENFYDSESEDEPLGKDFVEEDSDLSDAASEHSEHDTASELEWSDGEPEEDLSDEVEEELEEDNISTNYYYGRNRFKWAKKPPAPSRIRRHNIIHLPGTKGPTLEKKPATPIDAWSLLFTDNILDLIVEHTNRKITDLCLNYGNTSTFVDHVDKTELRAFLGLMVLSGAFKSGHEYIASLFATDGTGRDVFRATMSQKRFLFLLTALRFDNQDTRHDRQAAGDKLAPISEIYELFNYNCQSNYVCSEYATVDEMLVGFRGRCSFRQYIKSKPRKYGLRVMCLCDAKTHYLINSFIYCGKTKEPNPRKLLIPTLNVLQLVQPIMNTNRNVTGDNWFTSVELIEELQKNGLTYVGTVNKRKPHLPPEFLPNKSRILHSSLFGFTRSMTVASYVPKKYRSVSLISSMHHDNALTEFNQKPEIIDFYNSTKSGVDALDQKCAVFSCQRRTRRWPMAIFGAMLDISRANSYVLLKCSQVGIKRKRREFIKSLGMSLISDHLKRRLHNKGLSRELVQIIKKTLKEKDDAEEEAEAQPGPARKYQRCSFCPRKRDRKVKTICTSCKKPACKDHSQPAVTCLDCVSRH